MSQNTHPLAGLHGLLIDLDGVVYTGRHPVPGAVRFLAEARHRQFPFLLVTNNSTASPEQVAERLQGMGIEARADEILTSADAAAAYVREHSGGPTRVLVVGEAGLHEAVARQGLEPVAEADGAAWVVVGLDRAFDYAKLAAATRAIRAGARFVATNLDALLPTGPGRVLPGAGSIVAAVRTAAGVEPIVIGKPEPVLFQQGLQRLGGLPAAGVAMVGDRLDTDVEGARRAGLRTVLVLSGLTSEAQAARADPPPDATLPDLAAVAGLLDWGR